MDDEVAEHLTPWQEHPANGHPRSYLAALAGHPTPPLPELPAVGGSDATCPPSSSSGPRTVLFLVTHPVVEDADDGGWGSTATQVKSIAALVPGLAVVLAGGDEQDVARRAADLRALGVPGVEVGTAPRTIGMEHAQQAEPERPEPPRPVEPLGLELTHWLASCWLSGPQPAWVVVAPVGASLQDLPPGRVIRIDPRVGLTSLGAEQAVALLWLARHRGAGAPSADPAT
eukprot:EG_transcript_26824